MQRAGQGLRDAANAARRNRAPLCVGAIAGALFAGVVALLTTARPLRPTSDQPPGLVTTSVEVPVLRRPLPTALGAGQRLEEHRRFWRRYTRLTAADDGIFPSEVDIYDDADVAYVAPIGLGNPPQPFIVLLDMGSPTLWVPSANCWNCDASGRKHNRFVREASSSFQETSTRARIDHGDGVCKGRLGFDSMWLGNISIPNVLFLEAEAVSDHFAHSEFDGVLGLGFQTAASPKFHTPLEALLAAHDVQITDKVFSFELASDAREPGKLVIGTLPVKRYPRGVHWIKLLATTHDQDHVWQVEMDKVSFGAGDLFGRVAVIDSSASCLVMPASDAKAFHDLVRKALSKDRRCKALPTIELMLGGYVYKLGGDDYGFQGHARCTVCVQASTSSPQWILGDVFHKKYPVAYDFGKPAIGLPVPSGRHTTFWRHCFVFLFLSVLVFAAVALLFATKRRLRGDPLRGLGFSRGAPQMFLWPHSSQATQEQTRMEATGTHAQLDGSATPSATARGTQDNILFGNNGSLAAPVVPP